MTSFNDLRNLNVRFEPLKEIVPGRGQRSIYSAGWSSTIADLATELRMFEAKDIVFEIAYRPDQFRQDGMPIANARPASPVVVLSFTTRVRRGSGINATWATLRHRYPSTKFNRFEDNVRALALGLKGLRDFERHGLGEGGQQYAGFAQLESPAVARGRALIEQEGGFTAAVKKYNPDSGAQPDDESYRAILAAKGQS